ncbi:anti-sigma factor [Georgenia muralis]|uniref:Anti-sigma-K factor rskA n=1 Tax=Georgenia muralis TaxID=154117 RepID=A0A3N4YYT8_9MICO|nr:anti-sigma factor [Georgenia muralis]RPF25643.1 anti-sigma-K factor rskA [Georgenia muralis]
MSRSDHHVDDETLALLALGEPADPAVAAHTRDCAVCRASLAELADVVGLARHPEVARGLERPGPHVWDRIAAELAAGDAPVAPASAPASATPAAPRPVAAPDAAAPAASAAGSPWWRRRTAWVAAASFALGIAGTLAAENLLATGPGPAVASAALDPLPGWSETGTASVHEVDGRRVLTVEVPGAAEDAYREVWLIDTEVQRLVSVGILTGEQGTFELPDGLDIDEYPIVDVSREPLDGNPAHSGDSIVRGQLSA